MLCTAQLIERYASGALVFKSSPDSNPRRIQIDFNCFRFCVRVFQSRKKNKKNKNRKDTNNLQNVGTAASKLLYTLHWTLLDAAEECADADREAGIAPREPFPYIFPLTCIQVLLLFFFFPFCPFFFFFFPPSVCFTFLMAAKWKRTFISPFWVFKFVIGAHLISLFLSLLRFCFYYPGKKKRNSFTFSLRYVTC